MFEFILKASLLVVFGRNFSDLLNMVKDPVEKRIIISVHVVYSLRASLLNSLSLEVI